MGSGYLWCYMDPRLYSTQGLLLRCWNGPFLSGKSNKIQPKISRQIQQITGGYKTEEHSTHVCANFLTINRSATSTKLCQQRINFLLLYCFFFLNSISRSRGFLLLFSQSQHENKQIFFSAGRFELAEVIEVIVFFFFFSLTESPKSETSLANSYTRGADIAICADIYVRHWIARIKRRENCSWNVSNEETIQINDMHK